MRGVFVLLVLVAAALAAPSPKKPFGSIEFESYWSLEEINEFIDRIGAEYPDITEVEHMGTSAEGRHIRGLRITNENHLGTAALPIIFVTAGVSARDWITTMTAINLIHELTEHYEEFRHIIDDIEWFVIPVANPDGYEFSRTAGNRAWIKNRSIIPGSECVGVNVERNFNFNFGFDLLASSNEPCSSNYRGPYADSEEETKTIQFSVDIMSRIQKAYITLKAGSGGAHSVISYPFSSNNELFMPNFRERITIANIMTDAISRQTGAQYRSGSESNINGLTSGTSGDYAAGRDHIPLVYTIFTPSVTPNGWDVPEDQINRIADEIFVGIEALAQYVTTFPMPDPWKN